jgi:hypothetical protein
MRLGDEMHLLAAPGMTYSHTFRLARLAHR